MKIAFTLLLFLGLTFMAAAQTVTFAEYKDRGDKCFAKADYECARSNYERALRIRSDDVYCKSQLKKTAEAEERKKRERLKKKELERSEKEQALKEQEAEKLRLAEAARLEQEQQARLKAEQEKAAQAAQAAKLSFFRTNYPKTTDEDKDGIPWPFDACPAQKGDIRYWGCPTHSASQWSQHANGEIPADALVLSRTPEGKRRFLAKAGVSLLGYIDEGQKEATIGAGNITVNVYDVLTGGAFKWAKPSPELYISGKAMPRSEVSTTNFIARFVSKKQVAAGVANPSNSHALFFDNNSDFRSETFDILINENAPVGILYVKKHKSIAISSLTLTINGIQTSYGAVEIKPGPVEVTALCKDKKKKILKTDKITLTVEANQKYRYVLGQLTNGTIALVEESKQGVFELAAH